jgi:starch synthase
MKILFASPEVAPFAKTGGLGDISSALPKAIKDLGHDIRIILPKYGSIDTKKYELRATPFEFGVKIGGDVEKARIYESVVPGSDVIVYLVDNERFFGRKELYTYDSSGRDDNAERFAFFCLAALQFTIIKGWQFDVAHLNDWQTALIAAYMKTQKDPHFAKCAALYSIHNMAYQGIFPEDKLPLTGIHHSYYDAASVRENDKLNYAKAGIVFSDLVSTVSETYSREIQTPELGCGLENAVKAKGKELFGIVNGLDTSIWDPSTDQHIKKRYSMGTLSMRTENKLLLQSKMKLKTGESIPVIGMVSRLVEQKGVDILIDAIDEIVGSGCQLVVLGVGDVGLQDKLKEKADVHPNSVAINFAFDEDLAHQIYAGCDLFVMPSKFEPCGLGQLISFKYGAVPIVRKTGGLADTVQDIDPVLGTGTGFVFDDYSSAALVSAVKKAVELYKKNRRLWHNVQKRIMGLDNSWKQSAKKYVSLYVKALNLVRG